MAEYVISNANYRSRRLFLLVYAEDESDIVLTLTQNSMRWHYFAYIHHDQDYRENGELIEPHWHLILQLSTDYDLFDVLDWFKINTRQNAFGELVLDQKQCFEYLTHDTESSKIKHRYSKDDIRSNDLMYFMGTYAKTEQLIYDIICGADLRYLARTYGREYVINRQRYSEYAQEMWDHLPDEEKRSIIERSYFTQKRLGVINRVQADDPNTMA